MGSRVERERHANAITMVGVGMGDAWRAHEFPQHHYVTIILICQVEIMTYIMTWLIVHNDMVNGVRPSRICVGTRGVG